MNSARILCGAEWRSAPGTLKHVVARLEHCLERMLSALAIISVESEGYMAELSEATKCDMESALTTNHHNISAGTP